MGHLGLKARCGLIHEKLGVRLGSETLHKYYLKAGLVYRKQKRHMDTT